LETPTPAPGSSLLATNNDQFIAYCSQAGYQRKIDHLFPETEWRARLGKGKQHQVAQELMHTFFQMLSELQILIA
jgi:hypothetical protein